LAIQSLPGTNLVQLSWPSLSGFTVQRADTPLPNANWTSALVISSGLTNNIRYATISLGPGNRFVRLHKA
jgi:hypothetical protein